MIRQILTAVMVVVGLLTHNNAFATEEANRLELPQQIEVEAGATELLLPILMTNEEKMTGFQCDLYLPEGFAVATDEYDDYLMDLARTTTKRHSIATREMSDGALRIVLSSMTNATFSGNSGAVLNITISISNNVKTGSYVVNLKNIILTDPQAKRYTSEDVSGTIVVKDGQPVTITAQNLTMVYGDEVPELTYTSEGAELKGIPSLSCEATSTSPVGTYPIVVSQGTVENNNVIYVNGTLTITKAPLIVIANSFTITEGDTLPTFTATYKGFRNGETESVLTKQPKFTCAATTSSAPGTYDIIVSDAEAKNYAITYVKGTLTIEVLKKCATPTISYVGGKLKFSCETEEVQFASTITDDDINSYNTDEIDLSVTYTISVYATKDGYANSDVATGTLCWIEQHPDVEGIIDEDAVTEVKALPILIQMQGGIITIQGAAEGTLIDIYGVDGKKYGTAIADRDRATIPTSLQPGSVAIVKIGEKAIKVLIK
ncbi:MAG: hypothetical protein IK144_09545 [Bacteroidaceae bacterium]|nr:hypothetical protein [Bacteroidaceae bacterium]